MLDVDVESCRRLLSPRSGQFLPPWLVTTGALVLGDGGGVARCHGLRVFAGLRAW
jgi:hypothetical protein